jgi:hypothetical protein
MVVSWKPSRCADLLLTKKIFSCKPEDIEGCGFIINQKYLQRSCKPEDIEGVGYEFERHRGV